MVWNSDTNSDDLVSDITFWTDADTVQYPLADRARNANRGLDRVTALILKSDNGWKHDDSANSSSELLDVTTNLVNGTKKYALSVTWLKIAMIRIKDANGNWTKLNEKDRTKMVDSELNATSGTPVSYYRLGNWIYLDKAPNYSSTGGLEVQYQRGPSYFVPGDTTKTPGFASTFHRLISLYSALDYCEANDLESRAAKIRNKIGYPPEGDRPGAGLEGELVVHYSQRNEDEQPTISFQQSDYGQSALGNNEGFSVRTNGF